MNKIDVSKIIDPLRQQPFDGNSLYFLQDSIIMMLQSLANSLIGKNPGSAPYILVGCDTHQISGTNYSIDDGFFYWNGEMYYYRGTLSIHQDSNALICKVVQSADGTADPVTFLDGTQTNVHFVREIAITVGASGSGDFDYTSAIKWQQTRSHDLFLPIGAWNMSHTDGGVDSIVVGHGFSDPTKIKSISVIIVGDEGGGNDGVYRQLNDSNNATASPQGGWRYDATLIYLSRLTNGNFDSSDYHGSANRGIIHIVYVD